MTRKTVGLLLLFVFVALLVPFILRKRGPDNLALLDHHAFRNEPAAEPDPLLGFRLKESVTVNGFTHNRFGFIGPEFQKQKPAGVFRVFCLGGSTTLGAGVEADRYSYPELLQAILDKTANHGSKRIEIINAGVFGYNSLHTVIRATKLLDAFSPDMYVIMDGLNDLDTAQALSLTQLERLRGLTPPGPDTGYGLQDIGEKFKLVGYEDNLQHAIEHARSKGIQVLLVSDPMMIAENLETPISKKNTDLSSLLAFGMTTLPGVNQTLASRNHILFLNVQALFSSFLSDQGQRRRVWADDLHLTRYGYYILAKAVYHRLMAMRIVREAAGTNHAASDQELDALFPDVVSWHPADGTGWATDRDALVKPGMEATNCRDSKPAGDGWSFYAPSDPALPAEIRVPLDQPEALFRIFPRIRSVTDRVSVSLMLPDGRRRHLFELNKSSEDGLWTPETAWYGIPGTDCRQGSVVIRLHGENAQLWHKGDSILFKVELRR